MPFLPVRIFRKNHLPNIDVKATLKKKLDVDFKKYRILGACNPPFAFKALQVEDKIGTMLPCNVIVQEIAEGKIEVAAIDPIVSMQAVQNPDLHEIADQVQKKLKAVASNLSLAEIIETSVTPLCCVYSGARRHLPCTGWNRESPFFSAPPQYSGNGGMTALLQAQRSFFLPLNLDLNLNIPIDHRPDKPSRGLQTPVDTGSDTRRVSGPIWSAAPLFVPTALLPS
jgi:uncharacterized protein (DUF302 family)